MKYLYGDFIRCPRCGKTTLFVHPFKVEKHNELETNNRICQNYCRYYGTPAEKVKPEICNKCIKLDIIEGELVCNNCGSTYKIENGIPKLLANPVIKSAQVTVFDENTEEYDNWFSKNPGIDLFKIELDALRELMNNKKAPYRSLEVGVGTGQFAKELGITFGLDLSINALKVAHKRGVYSIYGPAENLPFQNNSFSLVLMVVSLCYIRDPLRAIKEVYRILNYKGEFITCFIEKNSPWGEFYLKKKEEGHKFYGPAYFYSSNEVKNWLESVGFKIKETVWTLSQEPGQEKYNEESPSTEPNEKAGFVCIKAEKIQEEK